MMFGFAIRIFFPNLEGLEKKKREKKKWGSHNWVHALADWGKNLTPWGDQGWYTGDIDKQLSWDADMVPPWSSGTAPKDEL